LVVPSVGVDVALDVMTVEGSVVDPPTTDRAYRLGNVGVSAAEAPVGSVYVAIHAVLGQGQGALLADVEAGTSTVNAGDLVYVDGVTFSVVEAAAQWKDNVEVDLALWDTSIPDRLVLFTCLPQAGRAHSTKNIVVVATRSG
jgi:hypothetical protein